MVYVYLIGTGIYAFIWFIFLFLRKDLRKKIFYSSLFAAPLGISEILFIPAYWTPKFQTIHLFNDLFLESILFCFFLGGVIAISYQVLFRERIFSFKKINPVWTLIAPALFLTYFLRPFEFNLMFYVVISMIVGSFITMFCLGRIAIKQIILSGLVNTLIYALLFFPLWYLLPELSASYQFQNLSGILLVDVPIEEFAWLFSFSLYWTPIYEIWQRYFKK